VDARRPDPFGSGRFLVPAGTVMVPALPAMVRRTWPTP